MNELVEELNRIRRTYTDLPEAHGVRDVHKLDRKRKLEFFRDEVIRLQAAIENVDWHRDPNLKPMQTAPWVRYVMGGNPDEALVGWKPQQAQSLETRLQGMDRHNKFEERYNEAFRLERRTPQSFMKQSMGGAGGHRLGLEDVLAVSRQVKSAMTELRKQQDEVRSINSKMGGYDPLIKLLTDKILREEAGQTRLILEQKDLAQKIDYLVQKSRADGADNSYVHEMGTLMGQGFGMKQPMYSSAQAMPQSRLPQTGFNNITRSKVTKPVWA